MQWIDNYQLFLFDFDGLLVNTEALHFLAYREVCTRRGHRLDWDEDTYAKIALFEAEGLKEALLQKFPTLKPSMWSEFYEEKRTTYSSLVEKGVDLMPGAEELLTALLENKKKVCVVTHSPLMHIEKIRAQHAILQAIPHWVTREHYSQPKPHPECYKKAQELHRKSDERVIGFEDSPRGLKALLGSGDADGVIVTSLFPRKEIEAFVEAPHRFFYKVPTLSSLSEEIFSTSCSG